MSVCLSVRPSVRPSIVFLENAGSSERETGVCRKHCVGAAIAAPNRALGLQAIIYPLSVLQMNNETQTY